MHCLLSQLSHDFSPFKGHNFLFRDNHCQCQSRLRSRYLWPWSGPYKQLFKSTTESTQAIKQVINRLVSIQGQTNLIEWDSYLRRFYRYATGLTSTMICPHPYQSSLKECKSYAINHCSGILHHQRTCLKSPLRRSSWFCHDGVFGPFHTIYEYIGHSCEEKPCFPFEKHNMGCVWCLRRSTTHDPNSERKNCHSHQGHLFSTHKNQFFNYLAQSGWFELQTMENIIVQTIWQT